MVNESFEKIRAEILEQISKGKTAQTLAGEIGISTGTMSAALNKENYSPGSRTSRLMSQWSTHYPDALNLNDFASFVFSKTGANTKDTSKLISNLGSHYLCFKLNTHANRLLVSHLEFFKSKTVTFRETVRLQTTTSTEKRVEFVHEGVAVLLAQTLSLLSIANSNVRSLQFFCEPHTGLDEVHGVSLGLSLRRSPLARRVFLQRRSKKQCEKLLNDYNLEDQKFTKIIDFLSHETNSEFLEPFPC